MDLETLDTFLLVGAAVLVVAILAVRVSVRAGVPSLIAYLLLGLLLGEGALGVPFEEYDLAQSLGFAALVIILAEGGLTTRWETVRPYIGLGVSLATVGVAVSIVVVAVFAHLVLGLEWQLAVLLGAVFAPTDAAAVFSTLRRVPLKPRLSASLEAESGLNDAPTVVLVILLSSGEVAGSGPLQIAAVIAYELAVGTAIGLAVGWLGAQILRRAALPASGLYPIAVMSFAVLAYASAAAVHASGFAAVYIGALVLGNAELPHRPATRSFAEGMAWLAQIGLFVMLGLLASPDQLPGVVWLALGVGVVLTVVARPLSVLAATLPFRLPWRERAFLSWAGLRGAVPVVLATIPLSQGVTDADQLFALVFVVTLVFTIVQATPLPWLARRLGVAATEPTRDLEVEAAPLERLSADLLEVRVPPRSRLHGVEIAELRLPAVVSVALVVRDGRSFVPRPSTALRHGDELLVVTPRREREEAERRLRAVSAEGRLAGWRRLPVPGDTGESSSDRDAAPGDPRRSGLRRLRPSRSGHRRR